MHTLFSLQAQDFLKGLIVAVFASVLTALLQMLQNGFDGIDYKTLALIAITSGISYLLKNFFTNSDGNFGKAERKRVR